MRPIMICGAAALLAGVSAAPLPHWRTGALADRHTSSRFYFSGDGYLDISHGHFEERLAVRYRRPDGSYDPEAVAAVRRFFRARQDAPVGDVSLRLIELIDFVQDRFRPTKMILISGYRSPEFNDDLRSNGARAAKASLHTEGGAADIRFVGLDSRRLWRMLRTLKTGGVGLYQQENFLHLDIGPPRFWEPQTSRVDENLSAGNARVFARTDFDRYALLDGALVQLYSVTELPLRIGRHARLGSQPVEIEPADDTLALDEDCWVIERAADAYRFRVKAGAGPLSTPRRLPLTLATCLPRIAATPPEVQSNPIERLP